MVAPSNLRSLVVVNPKSAGGDVERNWSEISRTIADNFGPFEHRMTRAAGDAARIAREAIRDGFEMVVALGGDGTISEVINGFFDDDGKPVGKAALGILPYGTGGDFRKTLHISKVLAESARDLRGQSTRPIDAGRLDIQRNGSSETRYFINIASFGIGGVVDEIVNTSSKALGGRLTFLLATLRAQFTYTNQRVRLVFDGEREREATINSVAVANGQYFGGGMHIAPNAEPDDGLFDVVTLGDFSAPELLMNGLRIYRGTHIDLPKVRVDRARVVEAFPLDGDEVRLDVDGETPGALPAKFTCLPRAINVKIRA